LYLSTEVSESDSESLDTAIQDDDQTILEESRPDEDIAEEIVDDPNVLSEVVLSFF
jgi:hypothetical protein